jgi:hypothetical protein
MMPDETHVAGPICIVSVAAIIAVAVNTEAALRAHFA